MDYQHFPLYVHLIQNNYPFLTCEIHKLGTGKSILSDALQAHRNPCGNQTPAAGKSVVLNAGHTLRDGDALEIFYGATHVDNPVDAGNGMYGTFVDQTLTDLDDVYYFAQRALWSCVDLTSLSLPANRAYVKLSEIDYLADPNPAPGRRRITMTVNGEKVATGMENINAGDKPMKLMINGQIFILRGEKMYDATGRLVK